MNPQISQISAEDRRDPQTYAIIGAAIEVHRLLGPGFLEIIYQEALAIELGLRSIPFVRETPLPATYKDRRLQCSYRADFVCYSEILVESKALDRLTGIDDAQVINYLKSTGLKRALLFNFGQSSLDFNRIVYNHLR